MPYAIAAAAIAAGGAVYSADQAKKGANAQVQGAQAATEEQRRQFDLTRGNNSQFLDTGTAANKRLQQLLGLGSQGSSGPITEDQVRQIYQRYMGRPVQSDEMAAIMEANKNNTAAQLERAVAGSPETAFHQNVEHTVTAPSSPLFADSTAPVSPDVGSLLDKFTAADLEADPVYQSGLKFGADQGRDAINARAMQAGQYDSGATLKALTRFGNDYGSTKAGESYNRFVNDQNNVFNRLSGVSGTGQVATNQIAASGANAANSIGASLEGAGNARAAGIVGGANAWGNAGASASTALNNYQNNQLLQKLLAQNSAQQTPYFQYAGYDSGGGPAYG